jgi:hypothetical protein
MIEHARIPEPLRWLYLDSECFVQTHPEPAQGESARVDLLEDLAR